MRHCIYYAHCTCWNEHICQLTFLVHANYSIHEYGVLQMNTNVKTFLRLTISVIDLLPKIILNYLIESSLVCLCQTCQVK